MERSEDRTQLAQLLIYSILSQLTHQKKLEKRLDESLGITQRKELEGKIRELEEEIKDLSSTIDSQAKIKLTQEEENKKLRERKKYLEKINRELDQEVSELRSEKNLLKAQIEKNKPEGTKTVNYQSD